MAERIVCNASPLIFLAKMDKLLLMLPTMRSARTREEKGEHS